MLVQELVNCLQHLQEVDMDIYHNKNIHKHIQKHKHMEHMERIHKHSLKHSLKHIHKQSLKHIVKRIQDMEVMEHIRKHKLKHIVKHIQEQRDIDLYQEEEEEIKEEV
eukprot:892788_1